jgi:hypothetical protein
MLRESAIKIPLQFVNMKSWGRRAEGIEPSAEPHRYA